MEPLRAIDATPNTAEAKRRAARSKPSQPLPTDRMKLDAQRRVLRTIGNLSADRKPISPQRLSDALDKEISHYTVALSHGFFVACGWLTRPTRGEYVATDALIGYSRRLAANADHDQANALLRAAVKAGDNWFWKVIYPQVEHGPARLSEVIVALMDAADVGEANRPQVKMLVDWLAAIDLIAVEGDEVRLVQNTGQETPAADRSDSRADQASADRAGTPVSQPTTKADRPSDSSGQQSVPLLSFGFSFALTAEDLAKLSPEQIETTFAAVGKLMAIKTG